MRRDWPIMTLLAAATVAVFWQVSWNGFVNFDDPAYVTDNPVVREGLTWPGVKWAFGQLHGEATNFYREALRLKPDFDAAMNDLAMLRASCKQPELRNGREAVQLAEAACRFSGRRNPSYLGTLAAAYAEAGRFPDAVKTMQEALELSRASGANDLLPIQTRMLADFRAGRAFR